MKTFKQWQDKFEEMCFSHLPSVVGTGDDSSTVVVRKNMIEKRKERIFTYPTENDR